MSVKDVRRGITQAHVNEQYSGLLLKEIFIIAIIIGVLTKSWWAGGGTFALFMVGLHFSIIAIPLIFILSLIWGGIGYSVGTLFESPGASWVIGIFAFLGGLGAHLASLEWMRDLSEE